MNLDLTGKSVLVTGSSRGIGRAIAQALHADGCRVALNSRNANDLNLLTSELEGSIGIAGDVSQSQVAKKMGLYLTDLSLKILKQEQTILKVTYPC